MKLICQPCNASLGRQSVKRNSLVMCMCEEEVPRKRNTCRCVERSPCLLGVHTLFVVNNVPSVE